MSLINFIGSSAVIELSPTTNAAQRVSAIVGGSVNKKKRGLPLTRYLGGKFVTMVQGRVVYKNTRGRFPHALITSRKLSNILLVLRATLFSDSLRRKTKFRRTNDAP